MKLITTIISRLTRISSAAPSRGTVVEVVKQPLPLPLRMPRSRPVEDDPFDTNSLTLSDDHSINPYDNFDPKRDYQ